MQDQIEIFADTILMMIVAVVSVVLMRADPLLPLLWGLTSFAMTFFRR